MMPTEKGLITITHLGQNKEPAKQDGVGQSVVTNVAIVSDQLVIDGANLDGVTKVRITGPSGFDQTFAIESQSASNLVANGLSNIAFAVGSVFDLILTDAQGAATHQVTFTLQDGAVTASKLDDMGAGVGQVLKYDGMNWGPSDLNSLTYAGNWNASTNSPDLTGGGSLGEYYIVSNAGSTDLSGGTGTNSWVVGDWAVWNNVASQWEKVENGSSVTSFNGRSGPVIPATNDYTWAQIDKTTSPIGDLSNVDTTGVGVGSVLKFDGTNWIVGTDNTAAAGSVDSTAITDGSIVDADVNASAAIAQSKIANLTTDLAAKVPLAGGTMTGDLTVPNLITSGNVDGVDVSALNSTVGSNSAAIAGKQNTITTGTTAQYLRGDLSLATFATDARSAAVLNSTAGTETDQAPSVAAMKAYVTANAGVGDFLADGSVAMTGDLTLNAQQELRLADSDSSNYVALRSPDPLAANYTLTFPADDGTPGQVLTTDGSGVLSWTSAASGSVTSVTASAPLASSGGATPNLTITQANGSTNGYLSSTDWTTFNSKQAAITTGATTQYLRGDLTLATLQDDVRATLLTGFSSGAGTVAATDTILQAVQKLDGNIAAKQNTITTGTTAQYMRGDLSLSTFATDARTAAVLNSTAGSQTDQAASVAAMKSYVATNTGDITNGGNTTGATVVVGTNDAQSLQFETNNSSAMTILNGGNVGIGTAIPGEKLSVAGIVESSAGGFKLPDGTILDDASDLGSSTTFTCPTGFTKMISQGNVLGCIQNDEDGTASCRDAIDACWTDHGARLPTFSVLYSAVTNYSLSNEFDDIEWTGESSYESVRRCGTMRDSGEPSSANNTDLLAYRCFIPAGANGTVGNVDGITSSTTTTSIAIDASGNVGIGTSSPNDALHVHVSNPHDGIRVVHSGTGDGLQLQGHYPAINFNRYWDGSNNRAMGSGYIGYLQLNPTNGDFNWSTGNQPGSGNIATLTERFTLKNNGNIGIGTANPSYKLHVVGSAGKTTGSSWTSISDRRLKDIRGDYEYGLAEIMKLNTVRFNYSEGNELGLPSDDKIVGFVAQEVQAVIPDAVHVREDGFLELNVDPIHWALVNATQEQQAIIESNLKMMETMERGMEGNSRRIAWLEQEHEDLKRKYLALEQKLKGQDALLKSVVCDLKPKHPLCSK